VGNQKGPVRASFYLFLKPLRGGRGKEELTDSKNTSVGGGPGGES